MATLPAVDLFSVSALILPFSTFIPSFSCFLTLRSFLRHSLWLQAEFRFHFSRYSPLIFCLLLNVQLFTRPSLNTHLSSLSIPHYLSFLILSLVPFLTTSLYALYSWLTLFFFFFLPLFLSTFLTLWPCFFLQLTSVSLIRSQVVSLDLLLLISGVKG